MAVAHAPDLPARYADIVNRRRPDLLGEVFAADVVWIVPGLDPVHGLDAAIQTLTSLLENYPSLLQLVGATAMLEDGGSLIGRTPITEWGRTADGFNVHMIGVYTDRIVGTDDGWHFAERQFEFFYRGRTPGHGKFYGSPGQLDAGH